MSNQAYNEMYGMRGDSAPMSQSSTASALDQMRDRLASLSDEARSIRSQVPHEFGPDVERIQQQMQRLGERLSDLSRGALVPYNAARRVYERRIKEVRYVTEDDVRVGRARPNQVIALGSAATLQRPAGQVADHWDEAAAEALVALYETGEGYTPPPTDRREMPAVAGPRAARNSVSNVSSRRPVYAAPGATPPATTDRQQGAVPYGCALESGQIDQRFAEIAARIEQSLAQIRPDAVLASLGTRFDQLETQINTALSQVATRADIEDLRIAESQIEEIASQLGHVRRQIARLDMIDVHLGTLTSQLADERLTRLFNEGVQVSADVGRLDAIDAQLRMIAVQLSDERLSGLVSRSASRGFDYEELANAAAQQVIASFADAQNRDAPVREIGEVRGMIENLINERRHNDENNASMLETMQQAIIRVLDRIDTLELAQQQQLQQTVEAQPQPQPQPQAQQSIEPRYTMPPLFAAPAPAPTPAPVVAAVPYAPVATSYDDLIPPTATVFAEMRGAESAEMRGGEAGEASDFLPMDQEDDPGIDVTAFLRDTMAEQAPPRVPVYTTGSFDLDAAFSRSRDVEAESFAEPQPEKRPLEVLRHDFIADAHRAKLKAASKPDQMSVDSDIRAGQLSVDEAPKARRRSIFSFRSQRVAMSLLILLAAIPAAIFFMPRTTSDHVDMPVIPASSTAAPSLKYEGSTPLEPLDVAPVRPSQPPAPDAPSKQTRQEGTGIDQRSLGEYEDATAPGAAIDTASLPDGIAMQTAALSGPQLEQINEQARMARMSGRLGIAAAHATPASMMEEQLLRTSGVDTGATKLPPPTVGPYSLRLAAAQGDAAAQFEVASRLSESKGADQDFAEAAQWYQRAASNGFAMAQFRLGTLYERGLGVAADPQRAQVWYERAAGQGNVKAMHNLAVLVASHSPKADYAAAARWFAAAADYGLADSQFNLAVLYENGMGVAKDLPQAYKWFILAAKSGDNDAAARRDSVKALLSAAEIATAEVDAETWRAKPIAGSANDARLAGQAWKDTSRRG